MGDFQDVPGDVVDPVIDMDFAARRAEAGFAGKGHLMLKPAARTDIPSESAFRIAAEHQPLDDISDICPLVGGNFAIQPVVDPTFPMVSENMTKAIMTGGKIGMLEGGTRKLIRAICRIHAK